MERVGLIKKAQTPAILSTRSTTTPNTLWIGLRPRRASNVYLCDSVSLFNRGGSSVERLRVEKMEMAFYTISAAKICKKSETTKLFREKMQIRGEPWRSYCLVRGLMRAYNNIKKYPATDVAGYVIPYWIMTLRP